MGEINLSNMIIQNVCSASKIHAAEDILTKRENRNLWAIAIKLTGKTEYYIDDKTIISDKNNIVILSKGSTYSWKSFGKGECLILDFDANLIADEIYSFKIKDSTELVNIFNKIEREKMMNRKICNLKCIEWSYHILAELLKSQNKDYILSSKSNYLKPIMEYISTNYNNPDISNDMLAKIGGISTVYFRKIFSEVYKIAPMNYVHNIRMKKAVEILQTDHGSITDVAKSIGYTNIYNFSKMFKKFYGVSPSNFCI